MFLDFRLDSSCVAHLRAQKRVYTRWWLVRRRTFRDPDKLTRSPAPSQTYIPHIATVIHEHNLGLASRKVARINLTAMMVSNPISVRRFPTCILFRPRELTHRRVAGLPLALPLGAPAALLLHGLLQRDNVP